MSALVRRDPFAREEIHRTRVWTTGQTCRWCGGVKETKSGRRYLYQYTIETDGGRRYDILHFFDSVSCMRSFTS